MKTALILFMNMGAARVYGDLLTLLNQAYAEQTQRMGLGSSESFLLTGLNLMVAVCRILSETAKIPLCGLFMPPNLPHSVVTGFQKQMSGKIADNCWVSSDDLASEVVQ